MEVVLGLFNMIFFVDLYGKEKNDYGIICYKYYFYYYTFKYFYGFLKMFMEMIVLFILFVIQGVRVDSNLDFSDEIGKEFSLRSAVFGLR